MADMAGVLGRAIGRARRVLEAARVAGGRRRLTITIAAAPDAALLVSAAALRRLGARITRYEADENHVEARAGEPAGSILVRATGISDEVTRLDLETDGPRALLRRFRGELLRPADERQA